MRNSLPFPQQGLYVITRDPPGERANLLEEVKAAVRGGAAVVQYRAKEGRCSVDEARALLGVCRSASIPLIINDDIDLALKVGADGVHLGYVPNYLKQYATARKELGTKLIVGAEIKSSRHEAMCLGEKGADYIAFGKDLTIKSKQDARLEQQELVAWWAELFEVSCVALDIETPLEAKTVSEAGADFIAIKLPQEITFKTVEKLLAPYVAALRS